MSTDIGRDAEHPPLPRQRPGRRLEIGDGVGRQFRSSRIPKIALERQADLRKAFLVGTEADVIKTFTTLLY